MYLVPDSGDDSNQTVASVAASGITFPSLLEVQSGDSEAMGCELA